jgi:hypothetical protein
MPRLDTFQYDSQSVDPSRKTLTQDNPPQDLILERQTLFRLEAQRRPRCDGHCRKY